VTYPPSDADKAQLAVTMADTLYIQQHYRKSEFGLCHATAWKLYTTVYMRRPLMLTRCATPVMLNRTPYAIDRVQTDKMKKNPGARAAPMLHEGYISPSTCARAADEEGHSQDVPRKRHIHTGKPTRREYRHLRHHRVAAAQECCKLPRTMAALVSGASATPATTPPLALLRHPALSACPVPIADWFWDDFHHNGVRFFLPHAFNFLASLVSGRSLLPLATCPSSTAPLMATDFFYEDGLLKTRGYASITKARSSFF
jgi:hypothetical protein